MEIIARYNNHRATYRHPARHRQAVQIFVPLKMRGKSKGRADGELNSKRGGIKTGLRSNCIFYISMSPHTPAAGSGAGATPVSSMVWYGMVWYVLLPLIHMRIMMMMALPFHVCPFG